MAEWICERVRERRREKKKSIGGAQLKSSS